MRVSHSSIKKAIAAAIAADTGIKEYCVQNFGRGLLCIVDWYGAEGAPGVKESPFAFIFSEGENEAGFVDEETFEFSIVVGGVSGANTPSRFVTLERTATANGVVANGIADKLEELREKIFTLIADGSGFGASFRSAVREESSTADYPLEWAKLRLTFFEAETLNSETSKKE